MIIRDKEIWDKISIVRNVGEKIDLSPYFERSIEVVSNEALLIKLADLLANITDHPTKAQEIRMLHNISALISNRKDLTDNTKQLAMMVFGS